MAKVVGYVEYREHKCPALPQLSIYHLMETQSPYGSYKRGHLDDVSKQVDWLNARVAEGVITSCGKTWGYSVGKLEGRENV